MSSSPANIEINIKQTIDLKSAKRLSQITSALTLALNIPTPIPLTSAPISAISAANAATQSSNPINPKEGDELTQRLIRLKEEYNNYVIASAKTYVPPIAHISIDSTPKRDEVYIEASFEGIDYQFEFVQEQHIDDIYNHLDSDPVVRAKFGDGRIVTREHTSINNKTVRERFEKDQFGNPKDPNFHLYGGFVVKSEGQFLGLTTLARSSFKGAANLAARNRVIAWSHIPDEIVKKYSEAGLQPKKYKGIATMETGVMLLYGQHLKKGGRKINGNTLEFIESTARVDNPGSWKALAKNGMQLKDISALKQFGPELRYHVQKIL